MYNELGKLRKQNSEKRESVTERDWNTIAELDMELRRYSVSTFELELLRKELIGMSQEAESQGKTLEQWIGMEPKEWCRNMAASYGKAPRMEILWRFLRRIGWNLLLFEFLFWNSGVRKGSHSVDLIFLLLLTAWVVICLLWQEIVLPALCHLKAGQQKVYKTAETIVGVLGIVGIGYLAIEKGITFPAADLNIRIDNYIIYGAAAAFILAGEFFYRREIHKQAQKVNWQD